MAAYADQRVQELEKKPRYNCLVRHMLESIRRMTILIPQQEALAQERLKTTALPIANTVLKSHIGYLKESSRIDKIAAPLQAEGLLIICQDVPHIPVP